MALMVVFVQVTEAAEVVDGGPTQQNDRACHIKSPGVIIPRIPHYVIEGRLDVTPAVVEQAGASDTQAAGVGELPGCASESGWGPSMLSRPHSSAVHVWHRRALGASSRST